MPFAKNMRGSGMKTGFHAAFACIFRTEPIVSTSGGIIQKNQWATDMKEVLPSSRIFISARTVQKIGINDHQEHRQVFEESL